MSNRMMPLSKQFSYALSAVLSGDDVMCSRVFETKTHVDDGVAGPVYRRTYTWVEARQCPVIPDKYIVTICAFDAPLFPFGSRSYQETECTLGGLENFPYYNQGTARDFILRKDAEWSRQVAFQRIPAPPVSPFIAIPA